MADGVILLDAQGRVVGLNPAAAQIVQRDLHSVIGRSAQEALAHWPALATLLASDAATQVPTLLSEAPDSNPYEVTVSPLSEPSHGGGRVVVLRSVNAQASVRAHLHRRDAILEAVAFAAQQLFQASDWDRAMRETLARLGRAADVSRAYVFENHIAPDGTLLTSQRHEWVAEGITPQIDNPELQNFPWIEGGFQRWVAALSRGEAISGLVRDFPERERQVLEAQDIRSILVLPIFVGEKWWGFLGFDECRRERQWQATEREGLRAAAGVIGIAIRRRRIEERLERLATVATQVTASLDLGQVLEAIAKSTLELVKATDVHIYLYDQERDVFHFGAALWENGRRTPAVSQPRPNGVTATVARSGTREVINQASAHPLFSGQAAQSWGIKSFASLPLKWGQRVVGVLNVAFLRPHKFTENELRVLELLANQAAVAIENARLMEAEREARQQAETLQQIAGILASVLEVKQLLGLVLEQLEKLVPYDSASVMLVQEGELRVLAARGFPEEATPLEVSFPVGDDPFVQEVSRTHRPLILEDAQSDPRFRRLGGTDYVRGWICAPLVVRDRVIGVLTVDSRQPGAFDEGHARLVQTFGHHAAVALENARLHEEIRRQAITDGLTGLYNHRYFYHALGNELVRSQRYGHPCSLMILDLDTLKHYNDRYGHLAGDDLLRELADLIRGVIRQADIAARYGGDEFALILPETTEAQALAVARRLSDTIKAHEFTVRGAEEKGHITVSIGVATYPQHARDLESLVEAADMALLRAKAKGKDQVAVCQKEESQT